jgi:hypothetical protein
MPAGAARWRAKSPDGTPLLDNEAMIDAVRHWLQGRNTARVADYIRDAAANPDRLPPYFRLQRRVGEWNLVRHLAGWNKANNWRGWEEAAVLDALRSWLAGRSTARISDYTIDARGNSALPAPRIITKYNASWRSAIERAGWKHAPRTRR